MFERWKLQHFAPGTGLSAGCAEPDFDDRGWMDITVPGDVHRTLIDNGRIPDPFYDQNESACTWMEEQEWWYRLHFAGADRFLSVRSEGNVCSTNRHFFVMVKDLEREPPPVTTAIEAVSPHELRVEMRADRFSYVMHLNVPHPGTVFSDNYFDLEPGESKTVLLRNGETRLAPQDVRIGYR